MNKLKGIGHWCGALSCLFLLFTLWHNPNWNELFLSGSLLLLNWAVILLID